MYSASASLVIMKVATTKSYGTKMDTTGKDKYLHFACGFILACMGSLWAPMVMIAFLSGVFKELWDVWGKGTVFDVEDLLATLLGASAGTVFYLLDVLVF